MHFIDPSTELKPSYLAFYQAWQNARNLPLIPKRQDISLREFASFADSMQIYELRARGQLHCRLMGSEIVNRASGFDPEQNILISLMLICDQLLKIGGIQLQMNHVVASRVFQLNTLTGPSELLKASFCQLLENPVSQCSLYTAILQSSWRLAQQGTA